MFFLSLVFNPENLFYNIVSFIVGILALLFTILNWKNLQVIFKALLIVFSIMFEVLGVIGCFTPNQYSIFIIIGFLFLCIATVASLVISNKWKEAEKNKNRL